MSRSFRARVVCRSHAARARGAARARADRAACVQPARGAGRSAAAPFAPQEDEHDAATPPALLVLPPRATALVATDALVLPQARARARRV
jgi:hypothetical protein